MIAIEEYIAGKPEPMRPRREELGALMAEGLPGSTQALKWGDLAIVHADGVILAMLSVHKNHCNVVVTPTALTTRKHDFAGFKLGKGTVQIPRNETIPREQIRTLIATRL